MSGNGWPFNIGMSVRPGEDSRNNAKLGISAGAKYREITRYGVVQITSDSKLKAAMFRLIHIIVCIDRIAQFFSRFDTF